MTVLDISMSGIRFKVIGPKDIKNGHRLHVRFTLDDQQGSVIDKEVRVVDIRNDSYSCEFLNLAYEEKELGYYLFPTLFS
ncbi:MAG: PilZ domain-containing protein [Desulfofustis sp.]